MEAEIIEKFLIGYGDGYGDGDGDSYGNGYGDGSGENISIQTFKGNKVYTIDDIPCYFVKVHDSYAEVRTIDKNSFEETRAFIGKYNGYFAHGNTIREAIEDAMKKCFSNLDFDEVKNKLLAEFKEKGKLTIRELYQWHGILTGSCRFGRSEFQKSHNLKDDDKLSLEEFVNLTKDAFNGDKIEALID